MHASDARSCANVFGLTRRDVRSLDVHGAKKLDGNLRAGRTSKQLSHLIQTLDYVPPFVSKHVDVSDGTANVQF